MQNKVFNIKSIPDVSNIFNEKAISDAREILCNYKKLIRNTVDIINISLDKNIIKPLMLYNMGFAIELLLKFYLIKDGKFSIDKIECKKHNIDGFMKDLQSGPLEIDELHFLLQKFKNKNGRTLDFNNYHDFKYNRARGQKTLIFDFECTAQEKNNIKDVINWISQYI